jgi:hypothetical protein
MFADEYVDDVRRSATTPDKEELSWLHAVGADSAFARIVLETTCRRERAAVKCLVNASAAASVKERALDLAEASDRLAP